MVNEKIEALVNSKFNADQRDALRDIAYCWMLINERPPLYEDLWKFTVPNTIYFFPSQRIVSPFPLDLESVRSVAKQRLKANKGIELEEYYRELKEPRSLDVMAGDPDFDRGAEIARLWNQGDKHQVWREIVNGIPVFYFAFPHSQDLVYAVRSIPGFTSKWDGDARIWILTSVVNPITADKAVREFINQQQFVPHTDLMMQWYGNKEMMEASRSTQTDFEPKGLKLPLYGYQKAGVEYGIEREKVLIADHMRLGKTPQALAIVSTLQYMGRDVTPAIAVVPKTIMQNWRNETHKFTYMKARMFNEHNKDADIVIVNFENLHKIMADKGRFKTLIIDESHRIKNDKTRMFKQCLELAFGKVIRILLTGTPIVNHPKELAPQLQILGYLKQETKTQFINRYCGAKKGVTHGTELQIKIRSMCLIRRMRKDVFPDLPDKTREKIEVELDNKPLYDKAVSDLIEYLRDDKNYDEGKLNRIAANEAMLKVSYLKRISAEGKLAGIIDFIQNVIDQEDKIIVFARHLDIINKLKAHFKTDMVITGDTKNRQAIIDRFQNNDEERLIILGDAAKEGFSLSASNMVAFAELYWTPAAHDQAEDRPVLVDKKSPVSAFYFLGKGTIDQDIYDIIESKRQILNEVTGSESSEIEKTSVYSELMKKVFNVNTNGRTENDDQQPSTGT